MLQEPDFAMYWINPPSNALFTVHVSPVDGEYTHSHLS